MPLKLKMLLVLTLLALLPSKAFSWAENGHRIVASIAEKRLSPAAKQAVKELLGVDSLPRVSTWMDFIKSDRNFDYLNSYHYVNIPEGYDYWTLSKNPKGDIVRGIIDGNDVLRDGRASRKGKKEALVFIIHLVGDIHQPLHAGLPSDKGGNDTKVTWFGKKTNLHKIWDEELIESQKLSYTEYVDFINNISGSDAGAWKKSSVIDWLEESMQYRKQIYTGLIGADGKEDHDLGYEYRFSNIGLVEQRLRQGGVRLAFFLNNIFEGKEDINCTEIKKKLGDKPKQGTP
jgi:hypothetical protein